MGICGNIIQYVLKKKGQSDFGTREDNDELRIYGRFNGENDDEPVDWGGFPLKFQTNPLHPGPPDEPFSWPVKDVTREITSISWDVSREFVKIAQFLHHIRTLKHPKPNTISPRDPNDIEFHLQKLPAKNAQSRPLKHCTATPFWRLSRFQTFLQTCHQHFCMITSVNKVWSNNR